MSTHREQVLAAIALRLETVAGLTVRRNEALPEKIPAKSLSLQKYFYLINRTDLQ